MVKLKKFTVLGKNDYGTLQASHTYIDQDEEKVNIASFPENHPSNKIVDAKGDLSKLSEEELFNATGKGCNTKLRIAICQALKIDLEELEYTGYVNVTDYYHGDDGERYISTAHRGEDNGNLFYMTLRVPAKFREIIIGEQIDNRLITGFEVMASTDNANRDILKEFKNGVAGNM